MPVHEFRVCHNCGIDGITPPMSSYEALTRVAVLGSGTMGHGIAQVCAAAGYQTRLFDVAEPALTAARTKIEANLDKGIAKGKVTAGAKAATLANLGLSTVLAEATKDADMVIEAVPEKLDLKHKVLGEAIEHAADGAILATNTSSLSIGLDRRQAARPLARDRHPLLQPGSHHEAARGDRGAPDFGRGPRRGQGVRREDRQADDHDQGHARVRDQPPRPGDRSRGDPDGGAGRGQPGGHRQGDDPWATASRWARCG